MKNIKNLSKEELKEKLLEMSYDDIVGDDATLDLALKSRTLPFKIVESGLKKNDLTLIDALIEHKYNPGESGILLCKSDESASKLIDAFATSDLIKAPFIVKLSNLGYEKSVFNCIDRLPAKQLNIDLIELIISMKDQNINVQGISEKIISTGNKAYIGRILGEECSLSNMVITLLLSDDKLLDDIIKKVAKDYADENIYRINFDFFGKEYSVVKSNISKDQDFIKSEVLKVIRNKINSNGQFYNINDNIIESCIKKRIPCKVKYNPQMESIDDSISEYIGNEIEFDYAPQKSKFRRHYIRTTEILPKDITEDEAKRLDYNPTYNQSHYYVHAATSRIIANRIISHFNTQNIKRVLSAIIKDYGEEKCFEVANSLISIKKTLKRPLIQFLPKVDKIKSASRKKQFYNELVDAINSDNYESPIDSDSPGVRAILERYTVDQLIDAKSADKRTSQSLNSNKIVDFINKTPLSRLQALKMIKSPFRFSVEPNFILDSNSPLYCDKNSEEFFGYLDLLYKKNRTTGSDISELLIKLSTSRKNYFLEYLSRNDFFKMESSSFLYGVDKMSESDARSIIKLFEQNKLNSNSITDSSALYLIRYTMPGKAPDELIKVSKSHYNGADLVEARYENGELFIDDKGAFSYFVGSGYSSYILSSIQKTKRRASGAINLLANKTFSSLFDELVFALDSDDTKPIKSLAKYYEFDLKNIPKRKSRSRNETNQLGRVSEIIELIKSGASITELDHQTLYQLSSSDEISGCTIKIESLTIDNEKFIDGVTYDIGELTIRSLNHIEGNFKIKKIRKLTISRHSYGDSDFEMPNKEFDEKFLSKASEIHCKLNVALSIAQHHPHNMDKISNIDELTEDMNLSDAMNVTKYFFREAREEIIKDVFSKRVRLGSSLFNIDQIMEHDFSGLEYLLYDLPVSVNDDDLIDKKIAGFIKQMKLVPIKYNKDSYIEGYRHLIQLNPLKFDPIKIDGKLTNKEKADLLRFLASLDPRCEKIVEEFCNSFNLGNMDYLRDYDDMSAMLGQLLHKGMAGYVKQPWFKEKCKPTYLRVSNILSKIQEVCGEGLDFSIFFKDISPNGAEGWSDELMTASMDESSLDAIISGIKSTDFKSIRNQEMVKFVIRNMECDKSVAKDAFLFTSLAKSRIQESLLDLNSIKDAIQSGDEVSDLLDGYTWIDGVDEYIKGEALNDALLISIENGIKTVNKLGDKYVSVIGMRDINEIHDEANSIARALDKTRGNYSLNQKKLKKLNNKKNVITDRSDSEEYTIMVPQKCSELVDISTRYGWCTNNIGSSYHDELKKGAACIMWICKGEAVAENVIVQFYAERDSKNKFSMSSLRAMYPKNKSSAIGSFNFNKILALINDVDGASEEYSLAS